LIQGLRALRLDVPAAILDGTANRDRLEGRKLREAAEQFESVLIASMLEKFEAMAEIPGAEADAGGGTMHAIGVQALAGKLTESGGLGIAKLLIEKLGPSEKKTLVTKV
jgi:Rod binding domain-containing protein